MKDFPLRACRANVRGCASLPWLVALGFALAAWSCAAADPETLFSHGQAAFKQGEYGEAAKGFAQAATLEPASGTLLNLGLAEWRRGRTGPAILAWERSLWLDAFNRPAEGNLRFARKTAQLENPDLAWYEVVSSWLPVNAWAWVAGLSLWFAIGMGTVPGFLRMRKAAWHQAMAALGLAVFLLSLPAQFGVVSRSRLGFVLQKDTPLRLTPTDESQHVTRLANGEPARLQRTRGKYCLIRTSRGTGWVQKEQFSTIAALE